MQRVCTVPPKTQVQMHTQAQMPMRPWALVCIGAAELDGSLGVLCYCTPKNYVGRKVSCAEA